MSRARSFRQIIARSGKARVAIGACVLLVLTPIAGVSPASAAEPQPAAPVNLGTAAGFSVLAGPSITSTGAATVLALDLGVTGTVSGFPPGTVTGTTHIGDAVVETAHEDQQAAYDAAAAQTGGTAFGGDLAGTRFTPGLYTSGAAVTNSGTITLDAAGDPGGVFVFQVGAALSFAAAAKIVLANGALANNVYWQVVGAVALGAGAKFNGTVLGAGVVSLGEGASLKGRILTPSTVGLANSPVTKPIDDLIDPLVDISGGPTRSTNDSTPPISGTTDEPGTPLVTVTVGSQVLTARAVEGAWTMSANALGAGPHNVVASVTDPSGNTGTATQVLTVDASAPGVTIAGGASAATKDTTPTISGTTDEAGSPTVAVTVGGQSLTTTADAGGAWTVDAAALDETAHSVAASVTDAAGNTGTGIQVLTVDVTVPVLTINGGSTRATSDTSPWTYGTTAEQAGTTVQVSLGGQSLTATVQPGGTWGVSAEALASGTYTVLASITDRAQNTGTMTQSLQIGTVVTTPPVYRPDAEIRLGTGAYVGSAIYDVSRQRVTAKVKGRPAKTVVFTVRVTNLGNAGDRMAVKGTPRSTRFAVVYKRGSANVTAAVVNGTYRTGTLAPGGSTLLTVRVTKVRSVPIGSTRTFGVRAASTHDSAKVDTVAAVVKVVRG